MIGVFFVNSCIVIIPPYLGRTDSDSESCVAGVAIVPLSHVAYVLVGYDSAYSEKPNVGPVLTESYFGGLLDRDHLRQHRSLASAPGATSVIGLCGRQI